MTVTALCDLEKTICASVFIVSNRLKCRGWQVHAEVVVSVEKMCNDVMLCAYYCFFFTC